MQRVLKAIKFIIRQRRAVSVERMSVSTDHCVTFNFRLIRAVRDNYICLTSKPADCIGS